MSERSSSESYESQTRDLYREIGEFAVKFEHVCKAVQMNIQCILNREGLKSQPVTQILLSGLTADPLRRLLQSLLSETLTLSETDKKILKDLFTRFQKLTEIRNDHLHATIFVGWGSDPTDDFSQASMMKFHKDQKGAALKSSQVTSNLIDAHTKEAAALAGLFHRLIGCCAAGLSIEKNFTINSNGHACDPKQPCE